MLHIFHLMSRYVQGNTLCVFFVKCGQYVTYATLLKPLAWV